MLDRVPRSCSCGLFPWVALLSAKKYGTPYFQLESELQTVPDFAFVLVHNHASGKSSPSDPDIGLTRKLDEGVFVR
jgi:hypothetical protein